MSEKILHSRDYDESVEYIDNEQQLEIILESVSKYIGRIIIEFNSLEDSIRYCIKEIMSTSEAGDELVYVFLSEMGYSSLLTTLVNLYGQIIHYTDNRALSSELDQLEKTLRECATRRNQYAHANWAEISKQQLVRIKVKAKKTGVFHSYKQFDESKMLEDLDYIEAAHFSLDKFDEMFNERLQRN